MMKSVLIKLSIVGMITCQLLLQGCTSEDPIGGGLQDPDPTVTDFPIAYIKRPIPLDEDGNPVAEDLNDPSAFNPGARLYLRDRALPTAPERDISSVAFIDPNNPDEIPLYDVKDLSISPDGTKMVFAMRAPDIPNADDDEQPKWNIWEYVLETGSLTRVIASNIVAEDGHDVQPNYLGDGRIIFSSSRQRQSKAILLDEGKPQFSALEEDLNNPAFVIHVMDADGSNLKQVSFNQSHDLYPNLMSDGRIAFLRQDAMGQSDSFSLYTMHPDGTNTQRLYGYHSQRAINGSRLFLAKPQTMPDDSLLVLQKTANSFTYGGDPIVVDAVNYIEVNQQLDGSTGNAEASISSGTVVLDGTPSTAGLFHSVFPLWDSSENRILISWSPCLLREVDPNGGPDITHPCTQANLDLYQAGDYLVAPPAYGIWMWERGTNVQTAIVIAEPDSWITDPVIFQERFSNFTYIPDAETSAGFDFELASENMGAINIRSVYDFDGVDSTIDNNDTTVDGIAARADPTLVPPDMRTARFLKVIKSVGMPDEDTYDFDNSAFGVGRGQLMREILGYTPIEPDGSVKVKVPANVAFAFSVVDQFGQRINGFGRHQNWMYVRPGEEKSCNGCHTRQSTVSHGRADADPVSVYSGSLGNSTFPNSNPSWFADDGETMAETRARINGLSELTLDVLYTDDWTDPNLTLGTDIAYRYQDLQTAAPISNACASNYQAGCRITIHYEEHIQPLFELDRVTLDTDGVTVLSDYTCVSCHSIQDAMGQPKVPDGQLELTSQPSAEEPLHLRSYRELFFGDNIVTVVNGVVVDEQFPVIISRAGEPDRFLFQAIDANDISVFFLDEDQNFVYQQDVDTGLPIYLQDTDGTDIQQTDVNGNPLFETDANGDLVLDGNGNSIPLLILLPVDDAPFNVTQPRQVAGGPVLRNGGAIASARFFNLFRNNGSHTGYMSDAELRLMAEWLDIGAQYFNNPFLAPEN